MSYARGVYTQTLSDSRDKTLKIKIIPVISRAECLNRH